VTETARICSHCVGFTFVWGYCRPVVGN